MLPKYEVIAYSELVAVNNRLKKLVVSLNLVSIKIGERTKKVELREDYEPHPEPKIKIREIDKPKIIALAQIIIEGRE